VTRILFDTNIILDVLLERIPHVTLSARLWNAMERERAVGLVAAHAVTTIHYLVAKERGKPYAARCIPQMLSIFEVAMVDDRIVRSAMRAAFQAIPGDFEDAVAVAAGEAARCDLIVTRDPKGFRHSQVLAVEPPEALRLISA
jgi:predicted nucleic acid-binding protein